MARNRIQATGTVSLPPTAIVEAAKEGCAPCYREGHGRAVAYCANCTHLLCPGCSSGGFCRRCRGSVASLATIAMLNPS